MGWSYKEDEDDDERKEYPVVGSVTLSTEEYTDLVRALFKTRKKADSEHNDWYNEYKDHETTKKKVKELEERINNLQNRVSEFTEWINTRDELSTQFRAWKNEKLIKEQESEEE